MKRPFASCRNRRGLQRLVGLDLPDVSTVDESSLPDVCEPKDTKRGCSLSVRGRYIALRNAIDLCAKGEPLATVVAAAGVSERNFRRIVDRFLTMAPDGRLWGYRALIRRKQLNRYLRTTRLPDPNIKGTSGLSGAFGKLMRDYPSIEKGLKTFLNNAGVDTVRPNVAVCQPLFERLKDLCREVGVKDDEYPFFTNDQGRRALRGWFIDVYLPANAPAFVEAELGPSASAAFNYDVLGDEPRRIKKPWDEWQIDEHRIDLLLRYELLGEDMVWYSVDAACSKLIVIKDTGSGAVLAQRIVIGRDVSANDLLHLFWLALAGPPKAAQVLPDKSTGNPLDYLPGAGYPANLIAALRFSPPRSVALDNALAHLQSDFQNLLMMVCGCEIDFGQPRVPKARGAIESEFSRLAKGLTHQLPATTGSGPLDFKRKKSSVEVRKRINVPALMHAIDVVYANHNAGAARASGYESPLQRLQRLLDEGHLELLQLPSDKQRPHLFGRKLTGCPVQVDLKEGRTPFVWCFEVRYKGRALNQFVGRKGHRVDLWVDPDDLRRVLAFGSDGSELGILRAEGKWGEMPHDIRMRRWFNRLRREKALTENAFRDPLRALFAHCESRAQTSTQSAQQTAYLIEYLRPRIKELDSEVCSTLNAPKYRQSATNDELMEPLLGGPPGATKSKVSGLISGDRTLAESGPPRGGIPDPKGAADCTRTEQEIDFGSSDSRNTIGLAPARSKPPVTYFLPRHVRHN